MHPELLKQLEALSLSSKEPPSQETWAMLCASLSEQYEKHDRKNFLLEQALETLEHSQREYRTSIDQAKDSAEMVFESMSDALLVLDRSGRIIDANSAAEELFGEDRLEDKIIFKLLTLEGIASERDFIARLGQGSWPTEEVMFQTSEGAPVYLSCAFNTVAPRRGKVVRRVVCSLHDVTEQRIYTQQLEGLNSKLSAARDEALDASAAKSQFLANMSHELRTPLNAIMGYAELLQEEHDSSGITNPQINEDLHKIIGAAKHLLSLINDLLDLSKIEAGKFHLRREAVLLEPLLEECIALFGPIAKENNNTLEVSIEADIGESMGDRMRLKQILVNLLSNACKFTKNGVVKLSAGRIPRANADLIVIRVEDDGIGMPEEMLHEIFKPFTQVDGSNTRVHGGTGLGLTIARRLCRMMGGELTVSSEVGKGSCFEIELLATVHQDLAALAREERHDMEGTVVLLIDDDPAIQEIVRRQLAPCRVQLVIASDGEEGLMMARAVPPDVVVLDMLMPNMNGEQVLSRMRQDTELANVPVILISNQELDNSLIALGVEDFLLKPIERSSLLRSIGRFVDLARGQSNILIVEDDPMVRDILRRTIKLEGLSVLEARDGIEGLERLGQHPDISLILLDLMMPRMDGFTFLERVREDARHKNIPVVVLTAKTLDEQERELLEASTERVFGKDTMGTGELLSELIHVLKQQDHEGKKGAP